MKKFKEARAEVVKVTRWICPRCMLYNIEDGNRLGYRKQCEFCKYFFLLKRFKR